MIRVKCLIGFLFALAAGCSFDGSVDVSGLVDDGEADAAAGPTYVVRESMQVPIDGTAVRSVMTLELGTNYRLRVSGTCKTASTNVADAEYWDFSNPAGGVKDTSADSDVGLAVDDFEVDLQRTPRWGPYEPSHIYEVDWNGGGEPITAMFHDFDYGDNSGQLSLQILAPHE